MHDIYVKLKLPKCCRRTLEDIDAKKGMAPFAHGLLAVASLLTWLGERPIHIAIIELSSRAAGGDELSRAKETNDSVTNIIRETCAKLAQLHWYDHANRNDKEEAAFWKNVWEIINAGG